MSFFLDCRKLKGKRANLVAINMCTKTGPRICEQKTKGREA